jgi:hypothetical protein
MSFDPSAWLMSRKDAVGIPRVVTEHVVCADGFEFSLQGSSYHPCTPRQDKGPWTTLEIGFPSGADDLIMPWAEEPHNPTSTVYSYVPVGIIAELVEKHGGLK